MDEDKNETAREREVQQPLLEENRRLAQRYLELEGSTRRQLEKLRTANAMLAQGEAHMRSLLENADIGFALLDINARVVSANYTLCSLLGYGVAEITGISFSSFVYVGSLPAFSRMTGMGMPRTRVSDVIELMTKDGRLMPCRMAVSDWLDERGAPKGLFLLVFDVEDEAKAIRRLETMEEAVAETNKSRQLFLDVVSRELRTPAVGIMGMIRMLMDSNLNERQSELAGVIHTSADSIVRLVDDMVEIVRLDSSSATLNPVPIRPVDLAQGVANLFGVRAEEKGLEIKVSVSDAVPEWISADAARIRRVLAHFVDNALKFTEEGHVTVSIDLLGDDIRFMVSDTGVGIASDPGRDIFDDHPVEDSPMQRRHGGIGVGLPITKRLVAFLGGKIGYESEPGRGSEFHFSIPLQIPDRLAEAGFSPPPEAMRLAPMRVLLADANTLSRRVVKAYLQFDGHELTLVDNGLDAAEKCRFNDFDIVLLDINLPKLDGLQTLRLIRDDEKATGQGALPVVILTAAGRMRDRELFMRAGANGVLKKPIQPVELMALMASATGMEPLTLARPSVPAQYSAEKAGGALRRIDGVQLVNLRQIMLDDQFLGILRFFMEDAVPGVINLSGLAEKPEPDPERIAFTASKARGLAGYLGLSALSDLLRRIEEACRGHEDTAALRILTRELPIVVDDTLEELKRILPEAFATISEMSHPSGEPE